MLIECCNLLYMHSMEPLDYNNYIQCSPALTGYKENNTAFFGVRRPAEKKKTFFHPWAQFWRQSRSLGLPQIVPSSFAAIVVAVVLLLLLLVLPRLVASGQVVKLRYRAATRQKS